MMRPWSTPLMLRHSNWNFSRPFFKEKLCQKNCHERDVLKLLHYKSWIICRSVTHAQKQIVTVVGLMGCGHFISIFAEEFLPEADIFINQSIWLWWIMEIVVKDWKSIGDCNVLSADITKFTSLTQSTSGWHSLESFPASRSTLSGCSPCPEGLATTGLWGKPRTQTRTFSSRALRRWCSANSTGPTCPALWPATR